MTLREIFEKETGLLSSNCTGLGDYSGMEADYDVLSSYCKWLERKITSDDSESTPLYEPCPSCHKDIIVDGVKSCIYCGHKF